MFGSKKEPSSGSAQGMELASINPVSSATLGNDSVSPLASVKFAEDTSPTSSATSTHLGSERFGSSVRNLLPKESKAYKDFSSRRYKKKVAGEQFESFDYDAPDDRYRAYFMINAKTGDLETEATAIGEERVKENYKRGIYRWLNLIIIGVVTGNIAYWMTFVVGYLINIKWHHTWLYMQHGETAKAYFYYIMWVSGSIGIAGALAWWAPESAGSGIPQVKAYLNGNQITGLLRMKTFVAKMVGITACVTSGMPAGREGPMVHAGSILAAGLARGYSDAIPCLPGMFNGFDNTRDRRDFVSMGAAAGVAAAFNAPIGGILFSLEEVSTQWSSSLTWQTFVCAIIGAYTVNFLMASQIGAFADSSLVLFGHSSGEAGKYEIWEVFVFTAIAIVGGYIGAAYVWINEHITMARKKFWAGKNPAWRILEAQIVVILILTIFFFLPMAFKCKATPEWYNTADAGHRKLAGGYHAIHPVQYNCADGEYNEMATLLLTPQETTILQLYSRGTANFFDVPTLIVFTVVFFFCAVTAYGIAVPAGLFIPSMMIGAGMGRLVGVLLNNFAEEELVDTGLYALVGAAAVLGGITRMTISLTVIMVEITNDINYMLPIMLSVAVSKAIGDRYTESLYDVHMELAGIPYLESEAPQIYDAITAESIMSKEVVSIKMNPSVAEIQKALESTHNGFPVIYQGKLGTEDAFAGMASREQLERVLDQGGSVDLSMERFMDNSPYIVQNSSSLRRVLALFRGMGLRHLPVVDILGGKREVIGIISRKDFLDTPHNLTQGLLDDRFKKDTEKFMAKMETFAEEENKRDPRLRDRTKQSKKGSFHGGL